jgi:hypothetical protein
MEKVEESKGKNIKTTSRKEGRISILIEEVLHSIPSSACQLVMRTETIYGY